MRSRVIVIAGPTAAGKTSFAIRTALALDGEVISCDSMQLYKYMDIGSAKPTPEELSVVPHHLVDMIDPREDFSVAKYQMLAKEAVRDILSRGKLPVICGGTGLYLESMICDMDFASEPGDEKSREKYYRLAEEKGPEAQTACPQAGTAQEGRGGQARQGQRVQNVTRGYVHDGRSVI